MTSTPRRITVRETEYHWILRGNTLYDAPDRRITVFKPGDRGTSLSLDPYAWDLEIRPATIRAAIEFALDQGWQPETPGPAWRLAFRDGAFVRDVSPG